MAELYDFINSTGVIVADTSDLLTEVQDEYKDTFGQDLDTDPSTPQGLLITAETAQRSAVAQNNTTLANQINPNLAGGPFLDALWAFTGGEREGASKSTIANVTLTGVAATTIPVLSQARTAAGDIFESISTIVLDSLGNGTVNFQSIENGAIPAGTGQLTIIISEVIGWETVTNSTAAVLGTAEQSDLSVRKERKNTLGLQGRSLTESVISDVSALQGVTSVRFLENITASPIVEEGVNLVAHSIWVAVEGGTNIDIATALNNVKTGGANYNGVVSQPVVDPFSGQTIEVKFARFTAVPVKVNITVTVTGAVADPVSVVTQAVLDYADGLIEGFLGFTGGNNVSPFQIAGGVSEEVQGIFISLVEVTKVSVGVFQTTEIPIEIFEIATITQGDIVVTVE